ncbi:hypothetical protein ACFV4T_04390 [Streptomyces sp. NPDC059755]|uniref:hypothetical protein n=1 Tax=Streptomyces sp. NPDC059755 TaxID=3346934 RepID=UPI00364ED50D
MDRAAVAYAAARDEAEHHGVTGERGNSQAHRAFALAFADPIVADDELALAEQLLAGVDLRATTLITHIAALARNAGRSDADIEDCAQVLRADIRTAGVTYADGPDHTQAAVTRGWIGEARSLISHEIEAAAGAAGTLQLGGTPSVTSTGHSRRVCKASGAARRVFSLSERWFTADVWEAVRAWSWAVRATSAVIPRSVRSRCCSGWSSSYRVHWRHSQSAAPRSSRLLKQPFAQAVAGGGKAAGGLERAVGFGVVAGLVPVALPQRAPGRVPPRVERMEFSGLVGGHEGVAGAQVGQPRAQRVIHPGIFIGNGQVAVPPVASSWQLVPLCRLCVLDLPVQLTTLTTTAKTGCAS